MHHSRGLTPLKTLFINPKTHYFANTLRLTLRYIALSTFIMLLAVSFACDFSLFDIMLLL